MVTSRLLRPASRLLSNYRPCLATPRTALPSTASLPKLINHRNYATPSGVKEVAVRDALNEALAEELVSNDKVFVLGRKSRNTMERKSLQYSHIFNGPRIYNWPTRHVMRRLDYHGN